MKKRLFCVIFLITLLLSLTACGEGEEASSPDTPKSEHNLIHYDAKDPTCESRGYTAYEDCIDFACDYRENYQVLQPLGHDLIDVPEKEATLTEKGHTAYKKCSRCDYKEGYSETEFSCSEHSFETIAEKKATSTANGYTQHKKCSVCGHTEGYQVTRLGHPCMIYLPSIESRLSVFNLSEKDRKNIAGMYNAVMNFEEKYSFNGNATELDLLFYYDILQHSLPEAMMVFNTFESTKTNGKLDYVSFKYVMTKQEYTEKMEKVEEKLTSLLAATEGKSDVEKARFFLDYLVTNCIYVKNTDNRMNIYGALIEGKVLCDGFADAFNLLCNAAGLKCATVVGETKEAHAWNLVCVDGKYTYVDVTATNDNDNFDKIHYFAFGLSTKSLLSSGYKISENYKNIVPEAFDLETPTYKNGVVIRQGEAPSTRVEEIIKQAIQRGDTEIFVYSETRTIHNQVSNVFDSRLEMYLKEHYYNYSFSNLMNPDFRYIYYQVSYSSPK